MSFSFYTAMEFLRQGKAVRCTTWSSGLYLIRNDMFKIMSSDMEVDVVSTDDMNSEWELYGGKTTILTRVEQKILQDFINQHDTLKPLEVSFHRDNDVLEVIFERLDGNYCEYYLPAHKRFQGLGYGRIYTLEELGVKTK